MPNGGLDPAPTQVDWLTPAELSYALYQNGRPQHSAGIAWGPSDPNTSARDPSKIQTRMVFPTAQVRFGPFHLTSSFDSESGRPLPPAWRVRFAISVWGRSFSLYDSQGQFIGANLSMVELGSTAMELRPEEEQDVYVIATLPSVLTVVQLRATVGGPIGELSSSSFPAACQNVAANSGGWDNPCMQAAVNPLAVVTPRFVLLTIVPEPPGNCSWARLAQGHTAGAAIEVTDTQSTARRTITDSKELGGLISSEHSDFTTEELSAQSSKVQVKVNLTRAFGTPLSSGTFDCVPGPPRPNSGPGKGDLFILLKNPSLIYWDTADLTTFLFAPPDPQHPLHLVAVFAWQIATGEGLPPEADFTEEEKNALLAKDPFTSPGWQSGGTPQLPKRFVFLNQVFSFGQGVVYSQTSGQALVTVGETKRIVTDAEQNQENKELDLPSRLTMAAVAYGGGQFAAAAAAAAGLAASQGKSLADAVSGALGGLFSHETKITTTTTYSTSRLIDTASETDIIEEFLLQDPNVGIDVALYYDGFLGTYWFVPLQPGAGHLHAEMDERLQHLPTVVWPLSFRSGEQLDQSMPPELVTQLNALGTESFEPAPSQQYVVPHNTTQGLPSGLQLDASSKKLVGQLGEAAKSRTLFFALNAQHARVAQLWISLDKA